MYYIILLTMRYQTKLTINIIRPVIITENHACITSVLNPRTLTLWSPVSFIQSSR